MSAIEHINAANRYMQHRNWEQAAPQYLRALKIDPRYPRILKVLLKEGSARGDRAVFEGVLDRIREPIDCAECNAVCARIARILKRPEEAQAFRQRAEEQLRARIAAHGADFEAHQALGNLLREFGDAAGAVAALDLALASAPADRRAGIHNDRGMARRALRQLPEAKEDFTQAIALYQDDSERANSRFSRAQVLLLQGLYPQGFAEYEWRRRGHPGLREALSTLRGETVVLSAEQGRGDQIQMARYAVLAKRYAARVIIQCDESLLALLAICEGVDQVISRREAPPSGAVTIPMMSLPLIFDPELRFLPGFPYPYLRSKPEHEPALEPVFRHALGPDNPRKKIGFVWAGNPFFVNEHNRSCPLAQVAPLIRIPETSWFSLQVDRTDQERRQLNDLGVYDLGKNLAGGSYAATAAVVRHLDAIVSVDTSVAHLAGGLGKLTLVLLPYDPDWRWLSDGEATPWYPNARLFRQQVPGDWANLFKRVNGRLRGWIEQMAI